MKDNKLDIDTITAAIRATIGYCDEKRDECRKELRKIDKKYGEFLTPPVDENDTDRRQMNTRSMKDVVAAKDLIHATEVKVIGERRKLIELMANIHARLNKAEAINTESEDSTGKDVLIDDNIRTLIQDAVKKQ